MICAILLLEMVKELVDGKDRKITDSRNNGHHGGHSGDDGDPSPQILSRVDLKWNGWGYQDSRFLINNSGLVEFSGARYDIAGQVLPSLRPWMIGTLNIDLDFFTPSQSKPKSTDYPSPVKNERFLKAILAAEVLYSSEFADRLFHAHGHTLKEIYRLRTGRFDRIPGKNCFHGSGRRYSRISKYESREYSEI